MALLENVGAIEQQPEYKAKKSSTEKYPSLELVTKPNLTTAELAYYLDRRPQTLRVWACSESGPLRPKRINGILAWPTDQAKTLIGVSRQFLGSL